MMTLLFVTFVDLFVFVFTLLILVRVIASYVTNPHGRFFMGIAGITEPVLAPVRRLMPQMPGLDLSPLVTFLLLRGAQYLVHSATGL